MNAKNTSDNLIIREFTAPKQLKLFSSLKESEVSGQLTFTDPIKRTQWRFYIYLGDLIYATGGVHPIRRWQRNLIVNLPQIPFQLSNLQSDLSDRQADLSDNTWEYEQISHWLEQQIITPKQARNAILFVMEEILFDLTQARQVICCLDQETVIEPTMNAIKAEELIELTGQTWKGWEDANIADRSADLSPVILQFQELQNKTSVSAYHSLCKLLNGNRTLRDLAVQLRMPTLQAVSSLLPYIQSGIFGLVEIPDLLELSTSANIELESQNNPLIACIDDSLMISQMMEQIITMAGYRFVAINDSEDAISTLLERKPDLIFLDIVMPGVNGYDLCAQLRKYPEFEKTPIIFLTSNSGIIDRLRAKLVGSSDFLKKTVDADELLQKIIEHLP